MSSLSSLWWRWLWFLATIIFVCLIQPPRSNEFSSNTQRQLVKDNQSPVFRCQGSHSPHFVLFFTIWKRLTLTQLVIQHHALLQNYFPGTISLWLVGSQGNASRQLGSNLSRVYYTECPNYPISDKHNCGLQRLGQSSLASNIDGVIIIGSDDFCEHGLFDLYRLYYCSRSFPQIHFMGLKDYVLLDMKTMQLKRLYFCEYNPISSYFGVGRFLSKSLLEAMDWTLWEDGLYQGLDQSMTRKLWYHFPFMDKVSLAISPKEHDLVVLDVKSEASGLQDATNIWSLEDMMDKTQSNKNNLSYCMEPVNEATKYFQRFYSSFHMSLDQKLLSLLQPLRNQQPRASQQANIFYRPIASRVYLSRV